MTWAQILEQSKKYKFDRVFESVENEVSTEISMQITRRGLPSAFIEGNVS